MKIIKLAKNMSVKLIITLLCFFQLPILASDKFGVVEQTTIASTILGESRELVIYLPAGYQGSNERYPVLYITDGVQQGQHTAGTVDFLSKFDQAPKMIVVGITTPNQSRTRDLTLAKKDSQSNQALTGADRFLAYVAEEVIPLIKKRYRTLDYQALSGTSHGGQFAVNAMIKRPDLFDGIIAISPSLYWNDQQLLSLTEEALKNKLLKGRLFLSIANEIPFMTEPYDKLVKIIADAPTETLITATKTFSDESHNSTTLLGQYHGLKHLFANWAIPDSPQTLSDLQAVYNTRSKLLGITLAIPEDRANGYGGWLKSLNRKDDALALLRWNRDTYPRSYNTYVALISAYLQFELVNEAQQALEFGLNPKYNLSAEQQQQLKNLLTHPKN